MTPIFGGMLVLFIAAGIVIVFVAAPRSPDDSASPSVDRIREWGRRASQRTDDAVNKRGWSTAASLDLAGVAASAGTVVLLVAVLAVTTAMLGAVIALSRPSVAAWILPVLLPAAVVLIARILISQRIDSRRAAFAEQLEGTLQLIASGMRAGHSLQRAMASVSNDSNSPTTEEFARVVNEHRLGRDLSDALLTTAERMKSDDLAWTAQAVAIHREVGGNLGEVLDHVAETIRERQQIRRQVATLSSEGRVSAVILMALPVGIAALLAVISPGYLSMFVTTAIGLALLVLCLVLFVVGSFWLRAITKIKF